MESASRVRGVTNPEFRDHLIFGWEIQDPPRNKILVTAALLLDPGFCPVSPRKSSCESPQSAQRAAYGVGSPGWMSARGTLLLVAVARPGDSFPLLLAQRGRRPGLAGEKGFRGEWRGNKMRQS